MSDKPKTRAEEIAFSVGVKDALTGNDDKCPYLTEQYVQCWRDGYVRGKVGVTPDIDQTRLVAKVATALID